MDSVKELTKLITIDSTKIVSTRTMVFFNASVEMFELHDPLWVTAALRFFILEDLMRRKGYKEVKKETKSYEMTIENAQSNNYQY